MKNRMFILLLSAGICTVFLTTYNAAIAQVGIGTNAPSNNSVLDVTSTNKGIMLPRLNDTSNVNSPTAGLIIYDKQTKTPAYHDGAQWNIVQPNALNSGSASSTGDSITYTVTGANAQNGFTNGTYALLNMSGEATNAVTSSAGGGAGQGQANFKGITIEKLQDINSTGFIRALSIGTQVGSIEIKFFTPGSASPYYSVKLTNVFVTAYSVVANGSDHTFLEKIGLNAVIYGYKNWVANKSFAWDLGGNQVVTY